jgi:hypothetical protein
MYLLVQDGTGYIITYGTPSNVWATNAQRIHMGHRCWRIHVLREGVGGMNPIALGLGCVRYGFLASWYCLTGWVAHGMCIEMRLRKHTIRLKQPQRCILDAVMSLWLAIALVWGNVTGFAGWAEKGGWDVNAEERIKSSGLTAVVSFSGVLGSIVEMLF